MADFRYHDCDSYVLLTPLSDRAIAHAKALGSELPEWWGPAARLHPEDGKTWRFLLRRRGYIVEVQS